MSEWIDWKGGTRPVSGDTIVEVMWADGEHFGPWSASEWNWNIDVEAHLTGGGTGAGVISSYRIITNPHASESSQDGQ